MIDLPLVRVHLKADPEDIEDALITQYIESAVSICEGYCNRKFYADSTAQSAGMDEALVELADLRLWWEGVVAEEHTPFERHMLDDQRISRYAAIRRKAQGIVIDGTIKAAILLTVGHLYANRQDVVVGTGPVNQLPVGAKRMLEPYLWIGDLA